jgi:sterol desaturase/sphingolipid hydroxylase (fatty acid hydroxylase superfamily)
VAETGAALLRQLLLLAALLVPLELLRPARQQPLLRRGTATDLGWFLVSPFLINAGLVLLAPLAAPLAAIPPSWSAVLRAQPRAAQLVEIFLLAELGSYAAHRLSHGVPWLWRFHAVHHSTEELDWLAAHRQHPVEALFHLAIANLPVALFGFPLDEVAWLLVAQKVYTAYLHANVRASYGRLGAVLASPSFHHWHHDGDPAARPANFAATLPIFDVLFGTYRAPAGLPARYGVDEPVARGLLGQLLHPFLPAREAQPIAAGSTMARKRSLPARSAA